MSSLARAGKWRSVSRWPSGWPKKVPKVVFVFTEVTWSKPKKFKFMNSGSEVSVDDTRVTITFVDLYRGIRSVRWGSERCELDVANIHG